MTSTTSPSDPPPPESPVDGDSWIRVRDREELRRRLEELAQGESLDDAQVDFVLFFFRASDPVLYRPAAVALGRQLRGSPRLADWLRDYAAARGIPLGGGVPLSGARAERRVLLAAAAALARSPSSWWAFSESTGERGEEDPVALLPPELPVDRPADVTAYLRALRILLQGMDASSAVAVRAGEVIEEVVRAPELLQDRPVALSWGELVAAASSEKTGLDGEGARTLVRDALHALQSRFESSGARGVGWRLRLLRAMDGILRGLQGAGPPAEPIPELPGLGGFRGAPEELRERTAEALDRVTDGRLWWRYGERDRARTAFLLLAAAGEGALPHRELHALLDAFGAPPGSGAPARVVRLLAEREGGGPGEFIDATLLHAMEDEEVLLHLVPRGPPGEMGAVVADALEHRLRMGLATEPAFQPDELLARVEIRRPHPVFFRLLRTVVGDREFRRPDGEQVPLAQWLEALEKDARPEEPPPAPGPLGELRREIRRELLRLEAVGDPAELIRDLAFLLEGGGGDTEEGGPRDLRTLLGRLHPGEASSLASLLHDRAEAFRAAAPRTMPRHLSAVSEARAAVEAIRLGLDALLDQVVPRLPGAEGLLLERVLRHGDRMEAEWLGALGSVEASWTEGAGAAGEEGRWSEVVDVVARVPRPSHRRRLYPLVWATLVGQWEASAFQGKKAGKERERPERLLGWAVGAAERLPAEDREIWLAVVGDHWASLVSRGLDEGLETQVARLIQDPGPGALALLPGVDEVLERTRVWFFDCYRLGDAARVTRILNHRRGRGMVAALPRDLLAFFFHYSPLWLALLVGAILMLDFGDAWTAMAEVGDIRGIAVTFSLGVLGAFGYVTAELHSRVRDAPGDPIWTNRGRRVLRVVAFVGVSLLYTFVLVALLWWLLSGTDEVVHGEGAALHIVVWSGFTLFVGVFFGLMAKNT